MGIEQRLDTVAASLEANSAALKELHSNITALIAAFTNLPVVKPEAAKVEPPKSEKPAATPTVSATATTETTPVATVQTAPAVESPSDVVDYAKVKEVVLKAIAAKGQPAVLEVLAKFGVAKATALTVDQYPAVIEAIEAL